MDLSLTRRAYDRPGLTINPTTMAWTPSHNLIDGELVNHVPGRMTGWMRFFRQESEPLKVTLDLEGDFHEDICGKMIRLRNRQPGDRNSILGESGSEMDGFSHVQHGVADYITAGRSLGFWTQGIAQKLLRKNELIWDELGIQGQERENRRRVLAEQYRKLIREKAVYYPYAPYPLIEWFSEHNGRVVLKLDPQQTVIVDEGRPARPKTPEELVEDERRRITAMSSFLGEMFDHLVRRGKAGDDSVFGMFVG